MTDMEQVTQVANGVTDYGMMAVTAAVSCVAVVYFYLVSCSGGCFTDINDSDYGRD